MLDLIPEPYRLIAKIAAPVLLLVGLWFGVHAWLSNVRADERGKVMSEFTIAQQKADIADLQSALAEAKKRAGITEQSNADLSKQLVAGAAQRDAYAERMWRAASHSGPSSGGEAAIPPAAGQPGTTDKATFMADIAICDENTTRLINAKDWAEKQRSLKPESKPDIP